jgi:hypothetical protein
VRAIGERRAADAEIVEFLATLSLVVGNPIELTDAGRRFFHLQFVEEDEVGAIDVLRHQLLTTARR